MHLMTRHLGRAIPSLLTASLVVWIFAVAPASWAAAVGPQSLTLSAPQLAASAGDTVEVGISLSSAIGVTDLAAMKFAVRVDTSLVEPIDAVRGSQIADWPVEDFRSVVDGDRLSISAWTSGPAAVGVQSVPIGVGELVRVRLRVRDQALDGRVSPLDITATNDEQSIVMLSDPLQALPGIKTVDVDGGIAITNGFTCVRGDASGDGAIGTDDAVITLRFAAGLLATVGPQILCGADANGDLQYNSFDASWILSSVVGIPLAKAAAPDRGARPTVRLERVQGGARLVVEGADRVRAAELRVLASDGAVLGPAWSESNALLVDDLVDGQLRMALATTSSPGDRLTLEIPVESAEWASLVHLRLYSESGGPLDFDVGQASVAWSKVPVTAASRLALGSYPNPFNPVTTLRMEMPRAGRATLEIFDATGRRVTVLVDEPLSAGIHEVEWTGLDAGGGRVASGVYFARLVAAGSQARQRLLLVK